MRRVIVVDRDMELARAISAQLAPRFDVVEVAPEEALAVAGVLHFDILLCDGHIADARTIVETALARRHQPRVFTMSDDAEDGDELRWAAARRLSHLTKPIARGALGHSLA